MIEHADDLIILEPAPIAVPLSELGEGPCWDAENQALYWVDIPAGRVHRLAGSDYSSWDVGMTVGTVVPRASGGLVIAAANGFYALDTSDGSVTELAPAPGLPDTRMNDGACDRAGRLYAGTMASDETTPGQGSLYRLGTDHVVTELCTGIGISNGIGWSPDDRQMYYIDSFAYRVDVLDYDLATGQLGERRPFARLGSGEVVPDGLAVDSEGGVWVAVWGGSVIQRYDAAGQLTSVVRMPAAHVTSCAFGGPALDQLYITTAAGPGQGAGALFTCPAGIAGLPAHPYRG